jgi:membrane associated rhomboid family serine protease
VSDPLGGLSPPPPRPPPPPAKRPFLPVTYALLAMLAAVFAGELIVGQDPTGESSSALVRMGALFLPALRDGDYWRLGAAAFLHIGWLHIAMNSIALWQMLPQIELAFGSNLTLGFFCATALAANLTSAGWEALFGQFSFSAGASGGAFGVMGVTIALYIRIRDRFPKEMRAALFKRVLFTLAVNLGIAFTFPVNSAAHVGGLVSGLALGMLAPQRTLPPRAWQKPVRWLAIASILVMASMEGAAFARTVKPKPRMLRGPGVEAKIDGQFVPTEPGQALDPNSAAIRISRAEGLPPAGAGQEVRRIGGRSWVARTGKTAEGDESLTLVTDDGDGQLQIDFECRDPFCRGDKAEKLLEITARSLRASR